MANVYIATDGQEICLVLDSPTREVLQAMSNFRQRKVRWCATYEVPEGQFSRLLDCMQRDPQEKYVFPQRAIKQLLDEIPPLGWKAYGETLPIRGQARSTTTYDISYATFKKDGMLADIMAHPSSIYAFSLERLIEFIQENWSVGCQAHKRFLDGRPAVASNLM